MRRGAEEKGVNFVRREYARLAARYDLRWSFYIEATTGAALRRLALRPGERILDVGCGTGSLLKAVSQEFPGVVLSGVDASPEMLAVAGAKLGDTADLKHGRAEDLPFPDAAFDIVVSTSVLHYVREPRRAVGEFFRVLKPGGRVVVTDWCHDYLACRAYNLYLRLFNRAHFQTFGRAQCAAFLSDAEFADVEVESHKINWLWGIMTATGEKPSPDSGSQDTTSRHRAKPG